MNIIRARALALSIVTIMVFTVTGCAADTNTGGSPIGTEPPFASASPQEPNEVVGQGLVLQVDDALPQLCLGAIAASLPPQCSGPEITGWNWETAGLFDRAAGSTWGSYAVQGNWTGSALVLTTSPIPLALYDPVVVADPLLDEGNAGPGIQTDLSRMQNEVMQLALPGVLLATAENGYLFVDVVHDVQPAQAILDARYGPGLVVVRPALRPVG